MTIFFKHYRLAALLFLALAIAGCQCEFPQPTGYFVPTDIDSTHHQIDAQQYGSAVLEEGDTISLEFPCAPELPALPEGVQGTVSGNKASLWWAAQEEGLQKFSSTAAQSPFQIQFTQPPYNFSLLQQIPVQPGDANNDGRTDMLDLYPIALIYYKYFNGWDLPNQATWTPPATLDPNQTYYRNPTGLSWSYNNQSPPVDLVHADCNQDGTIDDLDIDLLKQVLKPLQLPSMLTGGISQIQLQATQTGPIEIYQDPSLPNPEVRVWYAITINRLPQEDSILGVVFTRPVAEANPPGVPGAPAYLVKHIQARTTTSDLFPGNAPMVGHQRYWSSIDIELPADCDPVAFNAISKPLDVGVFNPDSPQKLNQNDCIIHCGVTIDDIMRTITDNGAPIFQHLMNVVVFSTNAQGDITCSTAECEFDNISTEGTEVLRLTNPPSDWYSQLPKEEN